MLPAHDNKKESIHGVSFLLLNILSSERMPCYSHDMKRYTQFRYSVYQPATTELSTLHKVIFVLAFLLVTVVVPCRKFPSGIKNIGEYISAVYGAELPGTTDRSSSFSGYSVAKESVPSGRSDPSAGGFQGIIDPSAVIHEQMKKEFTRQMSLMQQSKMINSSTCGRPWNYPLTEIQGRIRNVEYRVQPFTGRRGLHLDIETGRQAYTVIHVYPERLTAQCPSAFYFHTGEMVTVAGSEFFTGRGGMQQNICAATISRGKKVLGVRDPQTGRLERQLCCQAICEKNCIGLPPLCDRMCMMNCGKQKLKAVFRNRPFCPSCDKDYTTAISGR